MSFVSRGCTPRASRNRGVLFQNDDVTDAAPYDWSPDGKWIAVGVGRKDRTDQIGLVGVQDGSLRVLKSLDWKKTNEDLLLARWPIHRL